MAELPVRKRIFYGMGGLTMNLTDLLVIQWLLVRYVPPEAEKHLMPAALFGVLFFCGRMLEGGTNPFIAHWSDGLESRWGRRMPFIRFGLIPLALAFYLLFNPPMQEMHWLNIVFAIAVIPVYFISYGLVITPYLSLLPEITSDLKERVDLTTFQSVFLMLTTVVAFTVMPFVLGRWGWHVFAGSAAILVVLFMLPVALWIQEKPRPKKADLDKLRVIPSIILSLKNRPFRYVIGATAFYWYGLNGMISLITYWVLVTLARSEGEVGKLMGPFLVVNVAFFFVFNALSQKYGKYVLMLVTFLGTAFAIAAFALVGVIPIGSEFIQTVFVVALLGAPAAGFMVLPFAVLADVVDYDEQLTGRRREAIFFGVQGVVQKIFIGASIVSLTIIPKIASDGSKVLRNDESVVFTGAYSQPGAETGEITVPKDELLPNAVHIRTAPQDLDAPWSLTGPDGFKQEGRGDAVIQDLPRGPYAIAWGEVPGWTTPEIPPTPTVFGLKVMAILCAIACFIGFLIYLGSPLRERDGKVFVLGETPETPA